MALSAPDVYNYRRIRGARKDRAQPLPKRHFSKLAAAERELSAYLGGRLRSQGQSIPALSLSTTHADHGRTRSADWCGVCDSKFRGARTGRSRPISNQENAKAAGLTKEERGHTVVMRTIGLYEHKPRELGTDARSRGGAALSAHPLASRWLTAAIKIDQSLRRSRWCCRPRALCRLKSANNSSCLDNRCRSHRARAV